MWQTLTDYAAAVRELSDAVGLVALLIMGLVMLVAGLLRWIAYLYKIRREQDENPGHWPRRVD